MPSVKRSLRVTETGPSTAPARMRHWRATYVVFDRPPEAARAGHLDRMRHGRNLMHYEARLVSLTDTDRAVATATALLNAAKGSD